MTQILKQSTATDVLIGPFVDSTDGYTAVESGISPDVQISKNGQTLVQRASPFNIPTHDANGYYNCELGTDDTDTIGTLILTVPGSATSLPVRHEFQVINGTVYDAIYGTAGSFIDNKDLGILVETTIATVNSQTNFDLTAGITLDDTFIGQVVVIEDVSTGDFHETYITDCTGTGNVIVIAEAPGFTAVAGGTPDKVRIYKDRHPTYVINTYNPPTSAELTADTDSILAKLLDYVQLLARSDAAIAADNATALSEINNNEGSGSGTFGNNSDSLQALDVDLIAILADTNELQTDWANGGRLDTILDSAATSAEITALNDVAAADIWAEVLGTSSYSASALLQICAGVLAGELSGAATTTITIRNIEDAATLLTATVDASGNRTALTITTPSD